MDFCGALINASRETIKLQWLEDDCSITMAGSNAFQSPLEILSIAQGNKYLGIF